MVKTQVTIEPGKQEVTAVTIFDAPREKVFKAFTDSKLIPKWWGPAYLTTKIEKHEEKSGGQWRFVQTDKDGKVYAFHGVYHSVIVPERVVETFEYEGAPGHVLLSTCTFTEAQGKTTLIEQLVFQSVQDRDA